MFSQLIDIIVERTDRLDLRPQIIDITNGIIRRIQSNQYFLSDLVEIDLQTSELTLSNLTEFTMGTLKYVWTRYPDCRIINSVQYLPTGKYPPNAQPSVGQDALLNYWYKVGDKYCFITDDDTEIIRLTYFKTSSEMIFEDTDSREFIYDWITDRWLRKENEEYVTIPLEELEQYETEFAKRGNWILRDYKEAVLSGAISKVFSLIGDDRYRTEFAEFKELFATIVKNEKFANFGY